MNSIYKALLGAKEKGIKHPRIKLTGYSFTLAPASGFNAGCVYVKNDTTKAYCGKIDSEDNFELHYSMGKELTEEERNSLNTFISNCINDPLEYVRIYGYKTGNCSCCGKKLKNKESVRLGIGPICREKYGWGNIDIPETINETNENTIQRSLDL